MSAERVSAYEDLRTRMLANPALSYWARNAIVVLGQRDPVDVLDDLDALGELFRLRLEEISAICNLRLDPTLDCTKRAT